MSEMENSVQPITPGNTTAAHLVGETSKMLLNGTNKDETASAVTPEANITNETVSAVTPEAKITNETASAVTTEANITNETASAVTTEANITNETEAKITNETTSAVTTEANITNETASAVTSETCTPKETVTNDCATKAVQEPNNQDGISEVGESAIQENMNNLNEGALDDNDFEIGTANGSTAALDGTNTFTQDEWAKKQNILHQQISALEVQRGNTNIQGLQLQLKVKGEENEILKAKVINLETELNAVLKKPNAKNKDIVSKIKKQHEELLTKARGMIFDKTKIIKNQELQIEALTSQVASLKEVVTITKDLLGIRNMEVTHLQERIECMDLKIKAEKERLNLMKQRMEAGTKANEDLKNEYETQLRIFKELKQRYEEKFRSLEARNNPPQPVSDNQ